MRSRLRSETGAAFVFVALALTCIFGFLTFVIDQGVLLTARGQLQNAADAGALAGVMARAWDEGGGTPASNGPTVQSATKTAMGNPTWGGSGMGVNVTWPNCPPNVIAASNLCVRVDAHRDGTNNSTNLPVIFGGVLGLTDQSNRAMAIAQATPANGSRCLKPFLIPDLWGPSTDPTPESYDPPDGDFYVNPGFTTAHIGVSRQLYPSNTGGAIVPSNYFLIEDASELRDNIGTCQMEGRIGDVVHAKPGGSLGLVSNGMEDLITNEGGLPVDMIVAMYNPQEYYDQGMPSGMFDLTIVNMMTFRITAYKRNGPIIGHIVSGPGEILPCPGGGACPPSGGLISVIRLVR